MQEIELPRLSQSLSLTPSKMKYLEIELHSNVLAQILEERKLQFTIETGLEIQSIRTANSTTTVKMKAPEVQTLSASCTPQSQLLSPTRSPLVRMLGLSCAQTLSGMTKSYF